MDRLGRACDGAAGNDIKENREMTEQTNEPATPETESPAEAAARKGRGPTRHNVLMGDLVEDIERAPEDVREATIAALSGCESSEKINDAVGQARSALREHIARVEAKIALGEAAARFIARAEKLPPRLRRIVVLAFTTPDEPEADRFGVSGPNIIGKPAFFGCSTITNDTPEVPEGEGA